MTSGMPQNVDLREASAPVAPAPRIPLTNGMLAVGVGVGAFALTAWRSGGPSLWFDEAYAVGLANQPLSTMWRYLWGSESQMTLYYLLLHAWLAFLTALGVAHTEFLIRLPSVLAATLATVVVFAIGARWWGRATGLVAAAIFACNPLLLRQAQEARGYALQALFQTLTWYCFLAALSESGEDGDDTHARSSRWWWIAFAVVCALGIYAHIDTVVCLAAFPITLALFAITPSGAWRRRAGLSLTPFTLSLAAVGVLTAPLGYDALLHGGGNGWVPAASVGLLAQMTRDNLLAGVGWMIWPLLLCVGLAVLPRGPVRAGVAQTLAVCVWFVAPLALFWMIPHLFLWRYLVVIVAPFSLLIGIGVGRLRPPTLRVAVALLLLMLVVRLPEAYYAEQRDDYRTAATWLNAHYQQGDGLICWPETYCAIPMSYYAPELAGAGYPGGWNWFRSAHTSGLQATAYIASQKRIWLVLAPHGAFSPAAESAERASLTGAGFTPVETMSTPAVVIVLYVRR